MYDTPDGASAAAPSSPAHLKDHEVIWFDINGNGRLTGVHPSFVRVEANDDQTFTYTIEPA